MGTTIVDQAAPAEAPPAQAPPQPPTPSYVITAATNSPGVKAGHHLPDLHALAAVLAAKFGTLASTLTEPSTTSHTNLSEHDQANAYHSISRQTIASLTFSRSHDFVMSDPHDWQTIERACNEKRLPGGSLTPTPDTLTAAPGTPGWCAPCHVSEDFCPPAVLDGIVDLPTVIASRGCVTHPVMPDFGALYSQLGFSYPAADFDRTTPPAGTPDNGPWAKNKPCTPAPCSVGTHTCVLDPCGLCLTSSILVERAYDSLIEYFVTQALVAWGHRLNCRNLTQMIDQSTPVTVPRNQTGPGLTASVLEVMDFYATWLRYRHRLGQDATIEAVLPVWARSVVSADLAKRMGVDLLAVTQQTVDQWFLVRKIRVQWVMGLDEAYCDSGVGP